MHNRRTAAVPRRSLRSICRVFSGVESTAFLFERLINIETYDGHAEAAEFDVEGILALQNAPCYAPSTCAVSRPTLCGYGAASFAWLAEPKLTPSALARVSEGWWTRPAPVGTNSCRG